MAIDARQDYFHVEGSRLPGRLVGQDFAGWDEALSREFSEHAFNFQIGGRLLSETHLVRVWDIRLEPGERLGAHRHVLDYFWTAVTGGTSRQHTEDGSTREVHYTAGTTKHFDFADNEYLLHDLENIGSSPLLFVTVELKLRPAQLQVQDRHAK